MTNLRIEEVIDIIKSSELEDAVILSNNYTYLLEEMPEGADKVRVVTLRRKAQLRIKELQNG